MAAETRGATLADSTKGGEGKKHARASELSRVPYLLLGDGLVWFCFFFFLSFLAHDSGSLNNDRRLTTEEGGETKRESEKASDAEPREAPIPALCHRGFHSTILRVQSLTYCTEY